MSESFTQLPGEYCNMGNLANIPNILVPNCPNQKFWSLPRFWSLPHLYMQ